MAAADIGTGTTVTHATHTLGELLSVTGPSSTRPSIKTSHMGTTGNDTFIPGDLSDPGEVTLETLHSIEDSVDMNGAAGNLVITPAGGANSMTASAFVTGWEPRFTMEEMMVTAWTFKLTGAVTFT